jgi:hypothetical protein
MESGTRILNSFEFCCGAGYPKSSWEGKICWW